MSRTFWVVSEQYYPQETATGYLLTSLAEGLAPHLDVRVLCGQPPSGVPGGGESKRKGVTIHRSSCTCFNKDVLRLRLVNILTLSFALFVNALRHIRRGDTVLMVTNPPTLPFIVSFACWLRGATKILLIYDVYPEVLTATGLGRPDSKSIRFLIWLSRRLYMSADRIVVLSKDMEQLALTKLPPGDNRVRVIPNWSDLDRVRPIPRSKSTLLAELGLQDKFVVQYAGNMGRPNDLESLVEAATRLSSDPDLHFLFIGQGAKRVWLEQTVQDRGLRNVTILPPRPRKDQQNFLNACDVAVVSLLPSMTGLAVPSRTYNILAAGKPVLAVVSEDSELARVVREERIGWVVAPGEPELLVDALLSAKVHTSTLSDMGGRARRAAEGKYSLDIAIRSYLSVIGELQRLELRRAFQS